MIIHVLMSAQAIIRPCQALTSKSSTGLELCPAA